MAFHNRPKPPDTDDESWLNTYADAVTLLMTFFVLLVSVSKVDIPMYERVAAGIQNNVGKRSNAVSLTQILKADLEDVIYVNNLERVVNLSEDDDGIVLEFASSSFYRPGSAEIREDAKPYLVEVAQALQEPRYQSFAIEIEGHTDDIPINTLLFPTNWELSAARATRVVRLFISVGIDAEKLKASGLGETRPKLPNRTVEGYALPENQAANRRILARIYPKRFAKIPLPRGGQVVRENETGRRFLGTESIPIRVQGTR